jgi:DNA (cytosine-5)-methyltransferase 1
MSGSMRFGSVCSGIEAASVAWHPLGWKAAWLSEIEKFPCALLAHHYPDVPNLGDMTTLPDRIRSGEVEAPDVFCGGTPCQAFSVAGLRKSLGDARGNLSLTFCEIADAIDQVRLIQQSHPSIVFWENVPGVFNTKDNAFGCFLGALAGEDDALVPPGGRWTNAGFIDGPQRAVAWRVLDAQYFGVAQRRRRVFVIASARDDFDPAAVLFEFEGLRRDTAPSREKGQGFARTAGTLTANGGGLNRPAGNANELDFCIPFTTSSIANYREGVGTLRASGGDLGGGSENLIAARMVAFGEYVDDGTASAMKARDYKDATDLIAQPIPIDMRNAGRDPEKHDEMNRQGVGVGDEGDPSHTVTSAFVHAVAQPIPFDTTQITSPQNGNNPKAGDPCHPLAAGAHPPAIVQPMAVRRLTPVECERLQGFPDNYTKIADKTPDGPRYKALGNSWAVPVVRWIGERIARAT